MNKVLKPQLRFKGFTDPWEQRKLEYYLETSKEKNFDGVYGKTNVLSVSGDFGIVNQIELQGRMFAGLSVLNYGVVNNADIVYTKSPLKANPYGIIKSNKGRPGIVSTLYAIYKPRNNTFSSFVQNYFEQNARLNNYLHPLVNKGAKNDMKVTADNALKGTVIFPKFEEQKVIAQYFECLDYIITLHQRKYEKLINIKKSMLEKMFPENGNSIPEIRFKGFTAPWEQRKLGELYEKVSIKNDMTYGKKDIISVANMYYKQDSFITDNEYLLTYNVFKIGDIAFEGNKSKDFAHGRFVENTIGNGIVSHVFEVFKPLMTKYDLLFWKYEIHNEKVLGSILIRSTKASTMMTNLVVNDFLNEKIPVPKYEEQKSIGLLLNTLDNLITLHQRKLEKLKNIKKSCLEKMFI